MPHLIYGLYDPRVEPRMIRYVGYTSKGLKVRLRAHCAEAKQSNFCHRTKWIRSLLKDGIVPEVVMLERTDSKNWEARERHWIEKLRGSGKLTNSTDGGEGLVNPSQEVRDRIRQTLKAGGTGLGNQYRKGIKHSEEDKKKIRAGMESSAKYKKAMECLKGVDRHANMTEEQKKAKAEKISLAMLGKKRALFSEETKVKMSAAHVGKKHSKETKEKIRKSNVGNKHALGRIRPDSERMAISEAKQGTKLITDGRSRKFLKPNHPVPEGWYFVN